MKAETWRSVSFGNLLHIPFWSTALLSPLKPIAVCSEKYARQILSLCPERGVSKVIPRDINNYHCAIKQGCLFFEGGKRGHNRFVGWVGSGTCKIHIKRCIKPHKLLCNFCTTICCTNVAVRRLTRPDRPWVGHPCSERVKRNILK
jgi:hypothetical protein